ncbi:hypothetical protein F5Y04DRAFT_292235 [Hypomontagnella monticulosa]|nr:hypothetical protein F5Y04DRAFT_292235 [Hypomontagnella monticulosa]
MGGRVGGMIHCRVQNIPRKHTSLMPVLFEIDMALVLKSGDTYIPQIQYSTKHQSVTMRGEYVALLRPQHRHMVNNFSKINGFYLPPSQTQDQDSKRPTPGSIIRLIPSHDSLLEPEQGCGSGSTKRCHDSHAAAADHLCFSAYLYSTGTTVTVLVMDSNTREFQGWIKNFGDFQSVEKEYLTTRWGGPACLDFPSEDDKRTKLVKEMFVAAQDCSETYEPKNSQSLKRITGGKCHHQTSGR